MCCYLDLHLHVRAISITCLVLTAFSIFIIIKTIVTGFVIYEFSIVNFGDYVLVIFLQVVSWIIHLVVYTFSLIGAGKRNKYMLIPFLIVTSLQLTLCVGLGIWFTYLGSQAVQAVANTTDNKLLQALGGLVFLLIIPVFAAFGILLYFFIVVAKFYIEIDVGIIQPEDQPTITVHGCNNLQPNEQDESGGVATIYDPELSHKPEYCPVQTSGYYTDQPLYPEQIKKEKQNDNIKHS